MDAATLRRRINRSLVNEIDEVQFPSVTMMNRIESTLGSREEIATYADLLVKKVEATHYPSLSMLDRVDSLLQKLEQVERREREAAQEDGSQGD